MKSLLNIEIDFKEKYYNIFKKYINIILYDILTLVIIN